jgi:hypothetical protein
VAGALLAGAALLLTACSSATSSAASPASSPASSAAAQAISAPASSAPASSAAPSVSAGAAGSESGTNTFLAEGQDINGTALHEPACISNFGCALSGDSTGFLYRMTWRTWSATEAVGTGTYKVDGCSPNCAAGTVYPLPTVVTLSQPVKVCSSSGSRWFWSRASFKFAHALPQALQGGSAPQNPWTFSALITAAQQSCA